MFNFGFFFSPWIMWVMTQYLFINIWLQFKISSRLNEVSWYLFYNISLTRGDVTNWLMIVKNILDSSRRKYKRLKGFWKYVCTREVAATAVRASTVPWNLWDLRCSQAVPAPRQRRPCQQHRTFWWRVGVRLTESSILPKSQWWQNDTVVRSSFLSWIKPSFSDLSMWTWVNSWLEGAHYRSAPIQPSCGEWARQVSVSTPSWRGMRVRRMKMGSCTWYVPPRRRLEWNCQCKTRKMHWF